MTVNRLSYVKAFAAVVALSLVALACDKDTPKDPVPTTTGTGTPAGSASGASTGAPASTTASSGGAQGDAGQYWGGSRMPQ